VVTSLEEVDPLVANKIDDAVLLRYMPRPSARRWKVLQRFRLSNSREGVAKDGFDQSNDAECRLSIGDHPKLQIFNELLLKDGLASPTCQARSRSQVLRRSWSAPRPSVPWPGP